MLQQTTVAAVMPYFALFIGRWPTVAALAAADDDAVMSAWAGLGYYARARNLLKCARIVTRGHGGQFPESEAELRALPGIGPYTAAAIAAMAFRQRAVVVDGNVERVVARLFAVDAPLPAARAELYRLTGTITPERRAGDFAQAMMDLGSSICTPRAPDCAACPLGSDCRGSCAEPASYPRRALKAAKPERTGNVWWLVRDNEVLLVRRPQSGLLGGMRGLPTGGWDGSARPALTGTPLSRTAVHVFTHFRLTLNIFSGAAEAGCVLPPEPEWWRIDRLHEAGLPTVFAKVARIVMEDEGL